MDVRAARGTCMEPRPCRLFDLRGDMWFRRCLTRCGECRNRGVSGSCDSLVRHAPSAPLLAPRFDESGGEKVRPLQLPVRHRRGALDFQVGETTARARLACLSSRPGCSRARRTESQRRRSLRRDQAHQLRIRRESGSAVTAPVSSRVGKPRSTATQERRPSGLQNSGTLSGRVGFLKLLRRSGPINRIRPSRQFRLEDSQGPRVAYLAREVP